MKEATIIGLDGYRTDTVLVEDDVVDVIEIYEEDEIIGYQVAVPIPEGTFKPHFDLTSKQWSDLVDMGSILQAAIAAKKAEISLVVGAKILGGYKSDVVLNSTSRSHVYGTDLNDQQNAGAEYVSMLANPDRSVVLYRTQDALDFVPHTRAEFQAVVEGMKVYIKDYLGQGYALYRRLYVAKTLAEVNAIQVIVN